MPKVFVPGLFVLRRQCRFPSWRIFVLLALGISDVFPAANDPGAVWIPGNHDSVMRTGIWQWNSHRYAAESALETTGDGAALELTFQGRALVLCLDILTPPNNYGPPQLGVIEVFVDGAKTMIVRPRDSANEVTVFRATDERTRRVRLVHRVDEAGAGARIRGFRTAAQPSGDIAFVISGEKNGALLDARAVLTQQGRIVRDTLVRNWLTGDCRIGAVPPGVNYQIEVRAAGWKTSVVQNISVEAGKETLLPPIYLPRMRDVAQDAFTFPSFGYAAVRQAGGTFRARFAGQRAEIRGVRLVARHGPAAISRPCRFEEDPAAAFYYHREGTVSVPNDTPPGMYDLEITLFDERRTRILTSPRSVAIVTTFAVEPVFVSWGHLDTWGQYQAEYVGRLVEIANLLAADMVLVANEGNPAYAAGALDALEMPFVINFGNHRGPDPGPWFGEPIGVVDFGTSFTVLNYGPAWDHGTTEAEKILLDRATTRTKVVNAFEANAPVAEFLDRHRIPLIHYAHGPGPAVAKLGATPTIRVGKSNSESFRVIRFTEGRPSSYTYRAHATAPIPFPRGASAPIGVTYEPANDGTHRTVTGRFQNSLDESYAGARIVFVMPRGVYRVTGGRVEHALESDDAKFTVLKVRFDLPARASGEIVVRPVEP